MDDEGYGGNLGDAVHSFGVVTQFGFPSPSVLDSVGRVQENLYPNCWPVACKAKALIGVAFIAHWSLYYGVPGCSYSSPETLREV